MLTYDNYNSYMHKVNELEALILIMQYIPMYFTIEHIHNNQDLQKSYQSLDVKMRLNIDANNFITTKARKPINTHLITQPFTVCINKIYIYQYID